VLIPLAFTPHGILEYEPSTLNLRDDQDEIRTPEPQAVSQLRINMEPSAVVAY
jgi:hypothetical protein